MNSLFAEFGIEAWKPILASLLLPPVPLLALVLIGAGLIRTRRRLGWYTVMLGVALLWLTTCLGAAQIVSRHVLDVPAALTPARIAALQAASRAGQPLAIIVLGGGVEPYAPEYAAGNLRDAALARLRYGLWLGRATGAPVGFTGGVGHAAASDALPEARVAARIAAEEFGQPLRWLEDGARDTRENAAGSIALLRAAGIDHIVLVTHGWHMPRALRAFTEAAGAGMRIEAAPMGLATGIETPPLRWMPSSTGFMEMRNVLHERIGLAAGS